MPTETFTYTGSTQTWTVPDNVLEIIIRVWGAQGGNGGANGGYEKGVLSVSPGQAFDIEVGQQGLQNSGGYPNGGDGGQDSAEQLTARGGGGGGSSEVQHPASSRSDDILLLAGGGGGDPQIRSDVLDWDQYQTTDGAAGGGEGQDSSGLSDASGAEGGESGGYNGGNGSGASDAASGGPADGTAAGAGGGGGGLNGGEGGNTHFRADEATGGGGGDGYADSALTQTEEINGERSGDGKIEIEYSYAIPMPDNFSITAIAETPRIDLDWFISNSYHKDGLDYRIYRSQSPGVTISQSNRIDTITDGHQTSYSDTNVVKGESYYYIITSYGPSADIESSPSTEENILVAAYVEIYDSGEWISCPVRYWDESAQEWKWASSVRTYDENSDSWRNNSNR